MTTNQTYDTFVSTFTKYLNEVASFESGTDEDGVKVILDALNRAGLKELFDRSAVYTTEGGCDAARNNTLSASQPAVSKPPGKKPRAPRKTAAEKQTSDEQVGGKAETATVTSVAKKRLTAYNVFVAEKIKQPGMTMKIAANEWKTLSDVDKQLYSEKANASNRS